MRGNLAYRPCTRLYGWTYWSWSACTAASGGPSAYRPLRHDLSCSPTRKSLLQHYSRLEKNGNEWFDVVSSTATVVCFVTKPVIRSEAWVDFTLGSSLFTVHVPTHPFPEASPDTNPTLTQTLDLTQGRVGTWAATEQGPYFDTNLLCFRT